MSDELPKGWTESTVGEVTVNHDGVRVPIKSADRDRRAGKYPYYGASGIIDDIDDFLFDGEFLLIAEDGANLLSRSTPIAFRASGKFWVNNHAHVVQPRDGLLLAYLEHFLNSIDLNFHVTGSAQPKLTQAALNRIPIPLASLAEQRRIVAALDALLPKVEASRKRLERIPAILKRFRQAVLAVACDGRLTADWRTSNPDVEPASELLTRTFGVDTAAHVCEGLQETPPLWIWVRALALIKTIRGGSTVPPQLEPTDYPILRSSSVRPWCVDLSDVRFVKKTDSQNPDNFIAEGDLLFTRLSGSIEFVANCAIVPSLRGKRIQYPDRLFCARLKNVQMNEYIELCFANAALREELTARAKSSAGHQRVSISDITGQRMPLPPLAEQEQIVRRVEALFKITDRIEARYQEAKKRVDALTQSILAKAFRGELLPTEAALARREK